MGAIANAIMNYAQPLIDATDGSPAQLQNAMTLGQLCWNMALMPEEDRGVFLDNMEPMPNMTAEDLEAFKRTLVVPMIARHHEMFPDMHRRGTIASSPGASFHDIPRPATRRPVKKYAGTGRNERCPCGSGKKYKLCCGR